MDPNAEHESLNRFELFTKQLLANCGLELRKIPEGDRPMPDFAVFAGERQVAVLEVKSMKSTSRTMSAEEMALFEKPKAPLAPEEGLKRMEAIETLLRRDNGANRVAEKVHKAVKQFKASEFVKVLVFVNDGLETDSLDLREYLEGQLTWDDGVPFHSMSRDASRDAERDRDKIDLYIWIEPRGERHRLTFYSRTPTGQAFRNEHFRADQTATKAPTSTG